MQKTLQLDSSNRIVLSSDVRRAAGVQRGQILKVFVSPGRIVLELEPNHSGRIVKRGKLKVWAGEVPPIPLSEAVEQSRRYDR
ncbi:MAG TPA: AbrB/MazE/SpoVT family DNA-binding domain-containing protein [Terriglobales bacterium]|nr:AbrB/MazE/SpoVT family DNA-binding domain-containing protein [Terriglobales bacterium]